MIIGGLRPRNDDCCRAHRHQLGHGAGAGAAHGDIGQLPDISHVVVTRAPHILQQRTRRQRKSRIHVPLASEMHDGHVSPIRIRNGPLLDGAIHHQRPE